MLGRFADAEDVVQDVWLKWAALDQSQVREPKAYLVRMTTHLAIDRLRQAQSRRESYVGPWLPEPIATDFGEAVPDTAEQAVLADTVGVAVLVVLESLSPLERAVFVLREAFGYPFAEIAELLDRSEPAVRQLAGRARRHVDERRPRYTVDPQERRDLTERFLAAAAGGRLTDLMELLAPDVSLVADSGGKSRAPRRIVASADKVGRFLVGISDRAPIDPSFEFREVNGVLALIVLSQGKPDSVVTLETSNGRIDTIYLVRNPDKMAGLL
ncbi:ECF RNA polymerase sigma factor SigJ [Streptomyces sp. RB5]|uniref:ECF RNA polymerase sigma factor SigJ n=2 Tax=Streptomyces smaragdinus TaxID=2585196 RepID=A0A7K0CB24_9ACTN|nr:ECF RNA polymerase sigma factor SigJ [Streptomyces smaragdinus]